MTDEELALMRDRAEWHIQQRDDLRLVIVSENVLALLAEVDKLRKIVRVVADADNSDHSMCYQLCSYDMHWTDDDHQVMTHNAPCVAEQARALLGDRAEGNPQS